MKMAFVIALTLAELSATTSAWAQNANNQQYNYPLSARRVTGHRKLNRQAKKRRKAK